MAQIKATVGKRVPFAGGADTLYCKLQQINRQGVQIVAEGFNIEDITVEVILPGGARQEPTQLETAGNVTAIAGRKFSMDGIELSDVPAGSNFVTFIQL
jgi:hypothetical protein